MYAFIKDLEGKMSVLPVCGFTGYEGLLCFRKQRLYRFGPGEEKKKKLQSKQTRRQMRLENQRGRPLSTALGQWLSDARGNRANPTTREGQSAACSCLRWAPSSFMLSRDLLSVLRLGDEGEESSVLPATAGSACGTSPYPIIHLLRSAPTDQQSNFTQAGSGGGKHQYGSEGLVLSKDKGLRGTRPGGLSRRDGLKKEKETQLEGGGNVGQELVWLSSTSSRLSKLWRAQNTEEVGENKPPTLTAIL